MLTFKEHYLTKLIEPRSIVVIGASNRENSVGQKVFANLLNGQYQGRLYAVNPKHDFVLDQRCYPSVEEIQEPIDLAIITIPAAKVPTVLEECGERGIRNAIIMSAGFSEVGPAGKELELKLIALARRYDIRFIGPNCLGIMRPHINMNASFDNNSAEDGQIALISQSGAVCAAILDWAVDKGIGFSTIVSLGNSTSVDAGDLLDFLALDKKTKSILVYIEGIHDARGFMSGLRAASRIKPVIVIKAGRFEQGSRAALSHTGAMVGNDQVFAAALRRAGGVRADTIEELFLAAEFLSNEHKILGNRLAVITNGGGAGVMAADAAQATHIELPALEQDTYAKLNEVLPPHWSRHNPIDIIGDASPERYRQAIDACLQANNIDALLIILVPVAMSQPRAVAEEIVSIAAKEKQTMLACWMGEHQVKGAWDLFENEHIPYFATPENAVKAFSFAAQYNDNQRLLMQVPEPSTLELVPDIEAARSIIENAISENRNLLTTLESKQLLTLFSINTTEAVVVTSTTEAVKKAHSLRSPVVLKIVSRQISHKQDVGGVKLNLVTPNEIIVAFEQLNQLRTSQDPKAVITIEPMLINPNNRELMIGIIKDKVFGPVISFGEGGNYVEIFHDQSVELPPLNRYLAQRMIERTRISKALGDFRNLLAVDHEKIIATLLRVSEMICALPEIEQMDINPLIVNNREAIAVDARFVVQKVAPSFHFNHMAIHPYPNHLTYTKRLRDNQTIFIRPVKPEDGINVKDFIKSLSPESRYLRFMQHFRELTPAILVKLTQIDYEREMALLALADTAIIIGLAHYVMCPDVVTCEFGIVVADGWQNKGVGVTLLTQLIEIAKGNGFKQMIGTVLAGNARMLELANYLGFKCQASSDAMLVTISKALDE